MENRSVAGRGSKEIGHTNTQRETQEFPPGGDILCILKWWWLHETTGDKTAKKDTHKQTGKTAQGLSSVV